MVRLSNLEKICEFFDFFSHLLLALSTSPSDAVFVAAVYLTGFCKFSIFFKSVEYFDLFLHSSLRLLACGIEWITQQKESQPLNLWKTERGSQPQRYRASAKRDQETVARDPAPTGDSSELMHSWSCRYRPATPAAAIAVAAGALRPTAVSYVAVVWSCTCLDKGITIDTVSVCRLIHFRPADVPVRRYAYAREFMHDTE